MRSQAFTSSFSRVWFTNGGPGPARPPVYYGNWKPGALTWDRGTLTTIREPDPQAYGKFIRVGRFRGEPGDPELPLTARYTYNRSALLRAARGDCDHGVQVHIGQCADPQDFDRGWEKIIVLEEAAITNYGTEDLGALGPDETAAVNEDVTFQGTDAYEITRLVFTNLNPTVLTRETVSIYVCDSEQCGACGISSDGCQVVLALENIVAGSPGQAPTVLYTRNGGSTWGEVPISTISAIQNGNRILCIGSYAVVISQDTESLHYTNLANLLLGTVAWTNQATGFVVTKGPIAAWSNGASDTWFVGEGGYIYRTSDPTTGVTVSDAGNATTQDLNDVHFYDALNGVAVGASNAVVYTVNGGASWSAITGPAVGIVLNAVWMRSTTEWFVGTAGGALWYTADGGATWTQKALPATYAQVRDIVFVTPSVGYLAASTSAPAGQILRTTNGGYTWYVLPEGANSIPANDYVKQLAVCDDPNIVYGAGLADNAIDGFMVKAA